MTNRHDHLLFLFHELLPDIEIFECMDGLIEQIMDTVNNIRTIGGLRPYVTSINSYIMTNGFAHLYHLGLSTFISRGVRSDF